jgi:hypothetical protein
MKATVEMPTGRQLVHPQFGGDRANSGLRNCAPSGRRTLMQSRYARHALVEAESVP